MEFSSSESEFIPASSEASSDEEESLNTEIFSTFVEAVLDAGFMTRFSVEDDKAWDEVFDSLFQVIHQYFELE